MGLEIFREQIVFNKNAQSRITDSLLNLIDKERRGEKIDRILMKNLLRMLSDLLLYNELFENKFLRETQQQYMIESGRNIQSMSVSEYLTYIEKRLFEENERIATYLDRSSSKRLIQIVEKELIYDHVDTLFRMQFEKLFDQQQIGFLRLAYDLLNRIPDGSHKLCLQFNIYVKNRGKSIVTSTPEKDKTMVQELLDFKEQMDEIVNNCFNKNEKFVNSLKEAFEYFINQRTNKPAELIAKFIDGKLRSGNKESSEEEFERLLDKVMVIFRFIYGKDIFEAFYKKDLAKRLLVGKSASVDAEKSMLSKLKQECGSAFTSKLEGMFKDMELSRELMHSFKQYLHHTNPSATIDMNVSILTTGYWPTYQPLDMVLPDDLLQYEQMFAKFYLSKHMGRRLQWQRKLGHCVLTAFFDNVI